MPVVLADVAGYEAVRVAMEASPLGSRGIVVFNHAGGGVSHVVNVVHDGNGVVFLDGEQGRQAMGPSRPGRVRFVATTDGVVQPETVAAPWWGAVGGQDVAGLVSSGAAGEFELGRVPVPGPAVVPVAGSVVGAGPRGWGWRMCGGGVGG
jgi:hypothetical protein